jgi:hypothetical protein
MAQGKSGVGKWIAIGCAGLLLLGGCCVGGVVFAYNQYVDPPAAMTRGFFGNLRRGEYEQALARMNAQYQATHPLPTFQQNVQQIPALTQQSDFSVGSPNISGGVATVSGSLSTPMGNQPVTVDLSKLGDHWYIESVVVAGQLLH